MNQRRKSDLTVITKAKDLCSYVITITQKSPKQFRFTFVTRLQNLALDAIDNLYRANDVFALRGDRRTIEQRREYQQKAMTDLRLLCYIAQLACEHRCILARQYEQISLQSSECMNLLGGWMNSDRRRLSP